MKQTTAGQTQAYSYAGRVDPSVFSGPGAAAIFVVIAGSWEQVLDFAPDFGQISGRG